MKKTVLLIDDEKMLNDLYCQALRFEGFTVIQAFSGQEALQAQQDTPCQVIFLDYNLPDISGIELCALLQKQKPACHIHAISGDIPGLEDELAGHSPFTSHLAKPLDIYLLIATVHSSFKTLARPE